MSLEQIEEGQTPNDAQNENDESQSLDIPPGKLYEQESSDKETKRQCSFSPQSDNIEQRDFK